MTSLQVNKWTPDFWTKENTKTKPVLCHLCPGSLVLTCAYYAKPEEEVDWHVQHVQDVKLVQRKTTRDLIDFS